MKLRPYLLSAIALVVNTLFIPISYAQQPTNESSPNIYPWDTRPKKCLLVPEPIPEFCREPDSWVDYPESVRRVQTLFADQETAFSILDRAAAELAASDGRFKTGEYFFEAWYYAAKTQLGQGGQYSISIADRWVNGPGESSYAIVAKALSLYGQASAVRGGGFANTVSAETWSLYYDTLTLANKTLDAATPAVKRSGPWHILKVQIAFEHKDLVSERLDTLEAAARAWPDSTMLFAIPMYRYQPQWGGSFTLMEGVARLAEKTAKTRSGPAMYALVYERVFRRNTWSTLRDSAVDWTNMKKGFRDLEKAGGSAAWVWRNFAGLACQMRDRDEARRLYTRYDSERGSVQSDSNDACRNFAMEK